MQTILNQFCAKNHVRKYMMRPLRCDGFIYATNGYVAIRVPDDTNLDADSHDQMNNLPSIFNVDLDACELSPLPALPEFALCKDCCGTRVLYRKACSNCEGDGWFMRNNYDYDCQECDSKGKVEGGRVEANKVICDSCGGTGANSEQSILIGKSTYYVEFFSMLATLSNCMIKMPHSKNESLHFSFDGGVGILAGRKT